MLPVDKKKSFGEVTATNMVARLLEVNSNAVYAPNQELIQVPDARNPPRSTLLRIETTRPRQSLSTYFYAIFL
jgi:hypothetical protein